MQFVCYDIVTRRNTRKGKGTVLAARSGSLDPDRPNRVWVKWEGSGEDASPYDPAELDHFNPATDEA